MTTDEDLPPAGQLVLCWLLVQKEPRATQAEVKKGLPELDDRGAEETSHLGKALAHLEQRQLCRQEKNSPRAQPRIVLTESGRKQALRHLGLTALPRKATWALLRDQYLVPQLLGTPDRYGRKSEELTAVVLRMQRKLPTSPKPSLTKVGDAVCWRALGIESGASFSKRAVLDLAPQGAARWACPSEPR
ncbi:MAG: hypothetical protein WCI05_06595 [Myxococcales bacterium]